MAKQVYAGAKVKGHRQQPEQMQGHCSDGAPSRDSVNWRMLFVNVSVGVREKCKFWFVLFEFTRKWAVRWFLTKRPMVTAESIPSVLTHSP